MPARSSSRVAGAAAGSAGDVYSLGVMLAELLCPVQTQMERAKLIEELRNSGQLPSSMHMASPVVERMVMDMTHPAPAARPIAWEIGLNVPRLFSEVQRHARACALHLTLPDAMELPSTPRTPAARPAFEEVVVDQESPVTSVAVRPLTKRSPPVHFDAPESKHDAQEDKQRPAGDLQQLDSRPAPEAEARPEQAAKDVQDQVETLDSRPESSLRTSAGRQAPAVRVLCVTLGQADAPQGPWRAAGVGDLGRRAAPRRRATMAVATRRGNMARPGGARRSRR